MKKWCEHTKTGFIANDPTSVSPVVQTWNFCPICGAKRPEPRKSLSEMNFQEEAEKIVKEVEHVDAFERPYTFKLISEALTRAYEYGYDKAKIEYETKDLAFVYNQAISEAVKVAEDMRFKKCEHYPFEIAEQIRKLKK